VPMLFIRAMYTTSPGPISNPWHLRRQPERLFPFRRSHKESVRPGGSATRYGLSIRRKRNRHLRHLWRNLQYLRNPHSSCEIGLIGRVWYPLSELEITCICVSWRKDIVKEIIPAPLWRT